MKRFLTTFLLSIAFATVSFSTNNHASNQEARNFKFPDKTGKMISLSDFKGKVVYIDVWATWCGPCKREMPFLKKLEEQYHDNKDIVFLGVSVDTTKDKQKWLDFVEKEQLGGVQIFGGDAARIDIINAYEVSGIPRFILIGKDGKVILSDAPRPSSANIKEVLDVALKK